jgi:hypothetical protein
MRAVTIPIFLYITPLIFVLFYPIPITSSQMQRVHSLVGSDTCV